MKNRLFRAITITEILLLFVLLMMTVVAIVDHIDSDNNDNKALKYISDSGVLHLGLTLLYFIMLISIELVRITAHARQPLENDQERALLLASVGGNELKIEDIDIQCGILEKSNVKTRLGFVLLIMAVLIVTAKLTGKFYVSVIFAWLSALLFNSQLLRLFRKNSTEYRSLNIVPSRPTLLARGDITYGLQLFVTERVLLQQVTPDNFYDFILRIENDATLHWPTVEYMTEQAGYKSEVNDFTQNCSRLSRDEYCLQLGRIQARQASLLNWKNEETIEAGNRRGLTAELTACYDGLLEFHADMMHYRENPKVAAMMSDDSYREQINLIITHLKELYNPSQWVSDMDVRTHLEGINHAVEVLNQLFDFRVMTKSAYVPFN